MNADILANDSVQVSVSDQSFDPNNFFTLEEMGFRRDKVNFNKGWLGIFMENAEGKGILVKEITKGSPADEAGLKTGDIITKINGETMVGENDLNLIKFKKTVETIGYGGVPILTVYRDGAEMAFKPSLVAKLLKNVSEPVTTLIPEVCPAFSKEQNDNKQKARSGGPEVVPGKTGISDEVKTLQSPPSQKRDEGIKNEFLVEKEKTSTKTKYTDISFMEFAMKNERYREILGAALQRIGEEVYVREGFQLEYKVNPFRLSMINYLLLHPLDTPRIGQIIHDKLVDKDLCSQMDFAAKLLDVKSNVLNNKSKTTTLSPLCEGGESGKVIKSPTVSRDTKQVQKMVSHGLVQDQLQGVIDSLAPCVSLVKEAFRNLSQEEFGFLYQNAHKVWHPDEKITPRDISKLLTLSQEVDLSKLFGSVSLLLNELVPLFYGNGSSLPINVSPFHVPVSLQGISYSKNSEVEGHEHVQTGIKDEKDFAGDILFIQDTNIGKIVVGGTGTSYYYADAAVIIDLGGNDYYCNNTGSSSKEIPVSLCIDFSGNDVYNATNSFTQGTGRFGIGLLIDFKGNDRYLGREYAQGSCLFGVGLLTDNDGNDFYNGHVLNQGVGFFGAGMLSDLRGNDVYFSRQFAQGVGFTRGFGVLMDSDGNDFYFAGGEYPDFRDPEKSFQSMSQGMGMGIRPEETIVGASGGIGLLFDQKGSDQYHGDYFSQGSGYYFSLGFLCDKEGNDRYYAGRYAQGAGIHSAIGLLEDTAGDDSYECSFGVSQGCGHDTGIGFLLDNNGDDDYRSKTASQGAGLEKGMGILADFYGNDRYQAGDNSQGISSPSKNEEISSIGVLIDNQGDRDMFNDSIKENLLFYRSNGGLVLNK